MLALAATAGAADPNAPTVKASQASAVASGQAAGTFKANGKVFKLAHAAAFVDQKDEATPVILFLTDRQLPAATWTSEFDVMR